MRRKNPEQRVPSFVPQRPFVCRTPGGKADTAVVFIHGITEGPAQFRRLAEWTAALGMDAIALSLPGHGGSARDFARSGRTAWQTYVDSRVDACRSEYARLILVGHSMGGLLSVLTCLRRADGVAGIVTVGCPLHVWVSARAVRSILGMRYFPRADDSAQEAVRRVVNVAPGPTLGYAGWLPRLADLFGMMREVRRGLPRLSLPVLAVQGKRDELVWARRSMGSFRRLVPSVCLQTLLLPDTTHFFCPPADEAVFRAAFTAFCRAVACRP